MLHQCNSVMHGLFVYPACPYTDTVAKNCCIPWMQSLFFNILSDIFKSCTIYLDNATPSSFTAVVSDNIQINLRSHGYI